MAGDVIYIGLKSHQDLVLDLDTYEAVGDANGRLRTVKGKLPPVTLKADHAKFGMVNPLNIDGYVFTPVPVEFWDQWLALKGADSTLLADGVIKAAKTMDAAAKMAREVETVRGLNPRLAENDPRIRGTGVKAFDARDDGIAA